MKAVLCKIPFTRVFWHLNVFKKKTPWEWESYSFTTFARFNSLTVCLFGFELAWYSLLNCPCLLTFNKATQPKCLQQPLLQWWRRFSNVLSLKTWHCVLSSTCGMSWIDGVAAWCCWRMRCRIWQRTIQLKPTSSWTNSPNRCSSTRTQHRWLSNARPSSARQGTAQCSLIYYVFWQRGTL